MSLNQFYASLFIKRHRLHQTAQMRPIVTDCLLTNAFICVLA